MLHLGFSEAWVARVMECVSSVSNSFSVNGQLFDSIYPHRGLRQGDPLSPYLFLLCAEGLGALLKQAYQSRMLSGISIARGVPISHLFFADDSIIFTRASIKEAETIRSILRQYEVLSGQKANLWTRVKSHLVGD